MATVYDADSETGGDAPRDAPRDAARDPKSYSGTGKEHGEAALPDSLCTLRDGRRIALCVLGPGDRKDLVAGFDGLSKRSRYLRFLSAMPTLPDRILAGLLDTDGINHVAIGARLVAADTDDSPETRSATVDTRIVGVARYFRGDSNSQVAEPAVAVIDELHGLGVGKVLLRALTRTARQHGIRHFRGHAFADNNRIHHIAKAAHGTIAERDGPVVVYDVDLFAPSEKKRRGLVSRLLSAFYGPGN